MTTVIAFVSQKGGVGKSTLARALAREAAAGGISAKIADLDTQQGTAVDWHRQRLEAGLTPTVAVEAFKTAEQALAVAGAYDLLIVDGPARTSKATLEIARVADLIVQPTGASADDLRPAVREFNALTQAGVSTDKLVFALNRIGTDSEELSAAEMVAKAHRLQAREASLRADQGGATHRSAPVRVADNGHDGRLDDPAVAALLDRVRGALTELATAATALEAQGINPVRLKETIGTALPAGRNVVHLLGTLAADGEHRPGEEREAALLAPRGHGKGPACQFVLGTRAQAARVQCRGI